MSLCFLDCLFVLKAEHCDATRLVVLQLSQDGLLLFLVRRPAYHRLLQQLVLLLLNLNRITELAPNL